MHISYALALCAVSTAWAQHPQQMHITVERHDASGWTTVNPAHVFESGERLRFHITASFAGYLYVMDQGTSGSYELLFPRADTGSENRIEASKDYVIPAAEGNFRISGPAGHDVIYWLISPVDFGERYRPLPPAPTDGSSSGNVHPGGEPANMPSNLQPRCDDSIFRSRGDCIDTAAGVKPVDSEAKIPENMNGVVKPTPRELLFIQNNSVGKESVVISSPAPLTGPVVYELRLSHR
jgi:Domain of unknown function (DUF4384)